MTGKRQKNEIESECCYLVCVFVRFGIELFV